MKKNKNIIWIVIDTLRSDMLASCGSKIAQPNAIDKIIEQGVLFTDVMTTGGSTRISAPSYFSSLRPGLTGMTDHSVQVLRNFNDDAITVTEHFKRHGYRTLRWDDSSLDSCQPKRGFDVFESGYPTLEHTPDNDYDNDKRDAFIKRLRADDTPFFTNIHLDYIHDFGGYSEKKWSTEQYLEIVDLQGKDLEKLWDKLNPGPDDIVVITSDHGCILDQNYIEYDKAKPWAFSNSRTKVFASFLAHGLSPCKKNSLIRSIDIAPTLLDMALGADMHSQGVSLLPVLEGEPELELIGIAERNRGLSSKSITDFACVRKGDWSYIIQEGKPTHLCDNKEGELTQNHLGEGLKIESQLHAHYKETVLDGPQTPTELYELHGLSLTDFRGDPEVSIILPVFEWTEETRLCIESLLDQILFTELIILDADKSEATAEEIKNNFSRRLYLRHIPTPDSSLKKMLNKGVELAKGTYTVTTTPLCQYTENLCYSLREPFLEEKGTALTYPNLKRVIRDTRGMEYIGTDICFDEILFSRMGCGFEHNTCGDASSLPYFNEIGAVAMFRTEDLQKTYFSDNSYTDFISETWFKLNKTGKTVHVNKGLAISYSPDLLRPTMPEEQRKYKKKLSILIPLLEKNAIEALPRVIAMLGTQQTEIIELILLYKTGAQFLTDSLLKRFPDMTIRSVENNERLYELFNAGIFAAHGEFLLWLDPTEKILPNSLQIVLEYLEQHQNVRAVRHAYHLIKQGKSDLKKPLKYTREMLAEVQDLRGLVYKRDLHIDAGTFLPNTENEACWDMCIRLSLATPFDTIEDSLMISTKDYQFIMQPTLESYRKVMRNMINCMGGLVDLVRLYEDDFRRHESEYARFILEDEMMEILRRINQNGVRTGGSLRIPKLVEE